MSSYYRAFIFVCVTVLAIASNVPAQEALEIRGDQDAATAEPTPIGEKSEPAPPAEGESKPEAEAPPEKKKSANTVQEMSPEEFKRAGLDKLSPEELKTLNEWLRGYKMQTEARAAAEATEQTKEQAKEEARAEVKKEFNRSWLSTDRIYSRIQGQFHGLAKGGKRMIIVLEDGTVWKQANETDRVNEPPKLTDNPPVMVTHSLVGYKMHVIGAGEFWVNPVRKR